MRRKTLLITALLTALLFLVTLLFYLYTVNLVVNQTRERGLDAIAQIRHAVESETQSFQKTVKRLSTLIPAHIIIVDTDSRLLADSHNSAEKVSGAYINADLSEARQLRAAVSTLRNRAPDSLSVSVAQLVSSSKGEIVISVSYRVDDIKQLERSFILWLITMLILLTSLIILITTFQIKKFRKPYHSLLKHTEDAARNGFYKLNTAQALPEVSALVENFNSLVDRYNLLVEADNKKYSKINTLLSNLQTGILMVDSSNSINLVNPRAEELLNLDRLKIFREQNFSVTNNPLMRKILLETAEVNRTRKNRNITLNTKNDAILEIAIEAITNKYKPYNHSGALVIVRDVTEMRRLENLKDQFISNVSHELRTPLTVINGFVDTLKNWELLSGKERDSAIRIIAFETERLKKLISELLLLSRIEGSMVGDGKEVFDPAPLLREVLAVLKPIGEKKRVVSSIHIEHDSGCIRGVKSWFSQIVYNIYDNALKYTPEGGDVSVSLDTADGNLLLEVSDSGPGIPDSERERIFDRFYQINKSNTSKNSGSGLGLAIAGHMIKELGGSISVASSDSGGASFTVSVPLEPASTGKDLNDRDT